MSIRMYAIYGGNRTLLIALLIVGVVPIIINVVCIYFHTSFLMTEFSDYWPSSLILQ